MRFTTNSNFHYSPYKIVIYGPEGIGKTMLASRFPDPLFLDTEGSTRYYQVRRITTESGQCTPSSWTMLNEMAQAVLSGELMCKTLVIDSLDWAEALCLKAICDKYKKGGIEDFGFAKGYTYAEEEFGRFLNLLNEIYHKGINIVATAHANLRRIELPEETGAYDHWEMKLEKRVAALVKEWADVVLFCTYKTIVIKGANSMEKNKAAGGRRVMYSTHTPWWDAKNRFGLPEEMPLDFNSIAQLFLTENPPEAAAPVALEKSTPAPQTAGEQMKIGSVEPEPIEAPDPVSFRREQKGPLPFVMGENDAKDPGDLTGIPKELADLMRADHVSPERLQEAVAKKGYYPAGTPIANYDPGFISGCLVACWDSVKKLAL